MDGTTDYDDFTVFAAQWDLGIVAADALSAAWVDNPYGYCGYYADAETRGVNGELNGFLYHCRHREYDPVAGRWLQRDPAGFVDGLNLYGYYGRDPYGLSCDGGGQDSQHPPVLVPGKGSKSLADRQEAWWQRYYARNGHDFIQEETQRVDRSGPNTTAQSPELIYEFKGSLPAIAALAKFGVVAEGLVASLAQAAQAALTVAELAALEAEGQLSVWTMGWAARGKVVGRMLGENLPEFFPVFDRFVNGVATSIKSIDLATKTAQNGSKLLSTLKGHINKIAGFAEGSSEGVTITASQITSRELVVAIPKGPMTATQARAIKEAIAYGAEKGVQVIIRTVE